MSCFNIVDLIENNAITCLTNTYQNKLLIDIKNNFSGIEQHLFMTNFYCHVNHGVTNTSADFVVNFDDIWEWIGYCQKATGKRSLIRQFTENIDYIVTRPSRELRLFNINEGRHKETILLTVTTFKLFCVGSDTPRAAIVRAYFVKLEQIMLNTIQEQSNEFRMKLQNHEVEKELLREQTILEQYGNNIKCVYFGLIDDKSQDGESLIKFGNSNNLVRRVAEHKATYTNFRLVHAFRVGNHLQVETAIKKHPLLSTLRRTITINNKNYVEVLAQITASQLADTIKTIIATIEFNPENYYKMLEKMDRMESELLTYAQRMPPEFRPVGAS